MSCATETNIEKAEKQIVMIEKSIQKRNKQNQNGSLWLSVGVINNVTVTCEQAKAHR